MYANDVLSARRANALDETDNMPVGLRQCVHEYGYAIVQACLQAKVSDPRRIHQLVREIWDGARQPGQRREAGGTLDWILLQAGAQISAMTLLRVLADSNLAIVPLCPTKLMVEASMAECSTFTDRVTKSEKHRRRLTSALRIGAAHLTRLRAIPTPSRVPSGTTGSSTAYAGQNAALEPALRGAEST